MKVGCENRHSEHGAFCEDAFSRKVNIGDLGVYLGDWSCDWYRCDDENRFETDLVSK